MVFSPEVHGRAGISTGQSVRLFKSLDVAGTNLLVRSSWILENGLMNLPINITRSFATSHMNWFPGLGRMWMPFAIPGVTNNKPGAANKSPSNCQSRPRPPPPNLIGLSACSQNKDEDASKLGSPEE